MVQNYVEVEPMLLPALGMDFNEDGVPDDIQGIPWERLPLERNDYRRDRVRQYENYSNVIKETRSQYSGLADFLKHEVPECLELPNQHELFPFERNLRFLRTSIVHFQLRNLLQATAGHVVYAMHHNCIKQYNTITQKQQTIIDLSGQTRAPFNMGQVFISTMCAADGLVAAGGFTGEVAVATSAGQHVWSHRVADEENCITNHMDVGPTPSGAMHILASNNDMRLRLLHPETKTTVQNMLLPWASNCAVMHPNDRNLVALAADDKAVHLFDLASGKHTQSLHGHLDWGFAAAWHPAGHLLATGNQDCTTRLWDIRQTTESIAVLPASIGAIRSCRFSPDGRFLACAEPIDFVHLYDVENGLTAHQDIDFFGEISGISFTPGSEMLMVGVPDQDYTSTLCFLRKDLHDTDEDRPEAEGDETGDSGQEAE